ncbi:LPS export ABC transporter periplasmic protein LptC [Desulfococcaceae bacterium HSG7]|nr:LPS export ABC transporter periplasmic protein LptC [Desulfococcaceae bacterium HSG9]MDM8553886.1 LPS export ABC transporter periplasmic protein LptC [Desulfococcaceae bacterium HSG7]
MAGKRKKLKLLLIVIILFVLGVTATVFIHYRRSTEKSENIISDISDDATLTVGRVKQTQTKDGKKEWFLDAESVKYVNESKEAIFQKLLVTFYLEDEKEVYISANKGIMKTQKHNFEVTGNVIVKNEHYELKTDNLHYHHKKRFFFTKLPVEIVGASFNLRADSMSVDLNTKKSEFKGNVRGIFYGQTLLH